MITYSLIILINNCECKIFIGDLVVLHSRVLNDLKKIAKLLFSYLKILSLK